MQPDFDSKSNLNKSLLKCCESTTLFTPQGQKMAGCLTTEAILRSLRGYLQGNGSFYQ